MHSVEPESAERGGGGGARQIVLHIEPALYGATIRDETGRSRRERFSRIAAGLGAVTAGILVVCLLANGSTPRGRSSLLGGTSGMSLASAIKQFSEKEQAANNLESTAPASPPAQQLAAPASSEEAYDVAIPAGVEPGQTFLVSVPGRRERDVTAPSGTKPGETVSIDLPEELHAPLPAPSLPPPSSSHAPALPTSSLQSAATPGGGGVGQGGGGGGGGGAEVSAGAESAGAQAVDNVHSFFQRQRQEARSGQWVPGDTQRLPKLPLLRYTPSFSSRAPAAAEERAWEAGRPHVRRSAVQREEEEEAERGGRGAHFKVVSKGTERYAMAKPRYHPTLAAAGGAAAGEAIPNLEPFHTAAYSRPSFSSGGGGRAYRGASGGGASGGGGGGGGRGGGGAVQMPGFIVSTPDDSTARQHSSAPAPAPAREIVAPLPAHEQEEEEEGGAPLEVPPTRVVVDVKEAAPSPTRMEEVPLGSNGRLIFPVPTSSLPPQEYQLQPVVSAAPVTVTVHRPAPARDLNLKPAPPAPEVHPELAKIPALPHLKYFSDDDEGAAGARTGTFRHWDGKTLQVLNVVPETPQGAIDLDPHNWYQPPPAPAAGGERGFAPPLEQAREGKYVATQAQKHFVGADRREVEYRTFGEVGPAVGEEAAVHAGHVAAGMTGAWGR